jgi:hypothetical protein
VGPAGCGMVCHDGAPPEEEKEEFAEVLPE